MRLGAGIEQREVRRARPMGSTGNVAEWGKENYSRCSVAELRM